MSDEPNPLGANPGKLIIAGKIANREAEIAYLRYQAQVRDVLADRFPNVLERRGAAGEVHAGQLRLHQRRAADRR